MAEELKWAGFDMVNHANNHAMDYSFEGLHESVETLRKAGLVVAGAGESLADISGGELAALYCFLFLYMSARGSGPLSLDKILRRKG